MTISPRAAGAAILTCLLLAPSAWAQQRTITETDLFQFVWVADPQISPDGSRVAFVRVSVDGKKATYDTNLWMARVDGAEPPRRISGGLRDHSPRWSSDGSRLAFVRSVEQDGPQPPQIFVMSMSGGEARAITDMPRGAGAPAWAPDGATIAFTSTARPDEVAKKKPEQDQKDGDKKADPPRVSDVRVISEPRYRANGVADFGFVDADRPSQVWVVAVPAGNAEPAEPRQLTSGEFGVGDVSWARDGSRLYFTSDRRKDTAYLPADSDLYAIGRDGGEPQRVASIDGGIGAYALSPDGSRVAFVGTLAGNPERSYSQPDLWVADLSGGAPKNLTADYDFDIGGGLGGDQRAPRGGSPAPIVWNSAGNSVIVRVGEQGNANLKRIDVASGKVEPLTSGRQDVMSYTANHDARHVAFVRSTPMVVGDLHAIGVTTGALSKLTSFNDELFSNITQSEPEAVWYESFDKKRIQAWVLKPPSFDPLKKYPLIVEIHGGPHSAYGNTYTHEFQWMAAKGYVVFFTNPRGSSNYGQDFGNIIQFKYPGDDAKDILTGVDWIVKQGYVDAARMGVTGGSGGGLLTNWIVTQTTRFKAAVSQRDISDWAGFWYTADFTLFTPTWFRTAPFKDPKEFAERSPLTYVEKIETPILLILGDEDWRTPPSAGGEPLFRALKFLKKEAVMVRFPDENHDLSRTGKPWHRVERLQHIVGWFDKYLKP
ncbi:MAG: S9 family peptidase [Acidobacteriota bacterium]|nr:S9 family peptidase [Acidobacteriota bacterium]